MERYADQAAVDAHRGTEHFKALGRKMGEYMDGRAEVMGTNDIVTPGLPLRASAQMSEPTPISAPRPASADLSSAMYPFSILEVHASSSTT